MAMTFKKIVCPTCGNSFEYFTINDHIRCTKCNTDIPVEPMEEIPDEDPPIEG